MLPRRIRRAFVPSALAAMLLAQSATPALAHDELAHVDNAPSPVNEIGKVVQGAALPAAAFSAPAAGKPQARSFSLKLTRNPEENGAAAFTTPEDDCTPSLCREVKVTVPQGDGQTLYARGAWTNATHYAHVWGISPTGKVVGQVDVSNSLEKGVGNANVTPLAEFAVADPEPGVWRVQYRAVFGVDIPVRGTVALAKGAPLEFPRLDPTELADKHLTQKLVYNIVLVNRSWTKDELRVFRDAMPTEYRQSVLTKEYAPGTDGETGLESTALNWGGERYGAVKPYFEPTKYQISYRFLQANRQWTEALFAAMKKHTKQDEPFAVTPAVGSRRYTQGQYVADYDARQGKRTRGPDHVVTNPTVGDKIDAFAVEDWVFNTRNDKRFERAFTDLDTKRRVSARFIAPDPGAYYDPFYTRSGKRDLDRMPQGPTTSFSFFVLDTFGGGDDPLTSKYFRPNAYHYFDVSKHMVDPDKKQAGAGPDNARVWGGRYRFFLHDLGAGPNILETSDGFTANTPRGSADQPNGDPPIWDYNNDPSWAGQLAPRTARDAKAMLFSRLIGSYLYRPVPADVYFLASNNWVDCYSNPQCSTDGISYTELKKVYNPSYVEKNLSAAVPGVTFTTERSNPKLKTYRYLGCAANRAVANPDRALLGTGDVTPYVLVPDPDCVGKKSDKLQEALEYSKSRGDVAVGGVNDLTVNTETFRAFVERNRAMIAPQPPGQFTLTNISVVFPGAMTWALPAIVGGIALGTPNNEGWGILNNINDRFKGTFATNCAKSKPYAPGCNGVPALSGGGGFSYTVEHEASHFLGLLHPHDYQFVEKDSKGKWTSYGTMSSHYADFSMAPTTYFGDFAPYSVLDQDIIQRGHTAEYLMQVQDFLADAYQLDGMAGRTTLSAATKRKVAESTRWRAMGSKLFSCGDYLHAERALRNAALAAQGIYGPVVAPRQLNPGEKVLLAVNPQPVFGPDGRPVKGCETGSSRVPGNLRGLASNLVELESAPVSAAGSARASLPATGSSTLPAVVALTVMAAAAVVRRRLRVG